MIDSLYFFCHLEHLIVSHDNQMQLHGSTFLCNATFLFLMEGSQDKPIFQSGSVQFKVGIKTWFFYSFLKIILFNIVE